MTEHRNINRALRTARQVQIPSRLEVSGSTSFDVLIVDLNNFASFPTLAVGLLTAALRNRGHRVQVLCPLAYDVPATARERQETRWDDLKRRVHLSDWAPVVGLRDLFRAAATMQSERAHPVVVREVRRAIARKPDVVLVSAYLQHFESVRAIGKAAMTAGVPVLLGGPMFNIPGTAEHWRQLPGVAAVVGAEIDHDLPDLVAALVAGSDLLRFPGVVTADGRRSHSARPMRGLDSSPTPDFSDFPWDRYPVRIIPIMTGRGCQWDKCLFCSDVISVSGRTFRTRSVESVLTEMQEQAQRHDTTNFLFLDLKLNSWPEMLRGIAKGIGGYVQGAEWIGTVHVDLRQDNGLSRADLQAAADGGMRRISFGLESGSQRLLDLMRKGSSVERNAQFIRDAYAAGLSIRCTMFKGYPGETAQDMMETVRFLEEHAPYLDRVRFNDFSLHTGTPIWQAMMEKGGVDAELRATHQDERRARMGYRPTTAPDRAYRRAKLRALDLVYQINRRKVRNAARQFDGLM